MPRACWGSPSRSGRSQCRSSNNTLQFRRPEHPGPAAAPACRGSRRLSALGTPGGGARFGELLNRALGRPVTLAIAARSEPSLEEYWPDIAELAHRETVTDEADASRHVLRPRHHPCAHHGDAQPATRALPAGPLRGQALPTQHRRAAPTTMTPSSWRPAGWG